MKKSLGILSMLGMLILSGCGGPGSVVEYNDNFVLLVKECTDANQALFQNFNAEGATLDSIAESLQDNITICQNAQVKASKLGDYDKDSSLKDAVINLLAMEVDYLQKFSSTRPYWNIDNLTDEDKESYKRISTELNQTQDLLNQQFTNLQDVQEAFAVKHGLDLE